MFFKFWLTYFRHDCQNYSLRVQRSTVWKVIFFWEFLKRVFGLRLKIVQNSGEKFQQCCPNCPTRVSSVLSILHSKRRRTFWGIFCSKTIFFQWSLVFEAKCLELPAKSFQQSCQNCFLRVQWTTLGMSIIFSEFFDSFWTLSNNCPDLWQKFSAALPNVRSRCPKDFFVWIVLMFYLTSDSSEKQIRFEKKFRHFCWNCILSVPRTFWGVFIKNLFVFQFNLDFVAKFFKFWRNCSTESSKMQFMCPEEHFDENIVGFLK